MGIIDKIKDALKEDETGATVAANIEPNLAKGKVDVIGGKCPEGQRYCERRKICVPIDVAEELDIFLQETIYSGAGYSTGDIAGSGQTRVVGTYDRFGKETKVININKKDGVRFNKILGTYVPKEEKE